MLHSKLAFELARPLPFSKLFDRHWNNINIRFKKSDGDDPKNYASASLIKLPIKLSVIKITPDTINFVTYQTGTRTSLA